MTPEERAKQLRRHDGPNGCWAFPKYVSDPSALCVECKMTAAAIRAAVEAETERAAGVCEAQKLDRDAMVKPPGPDWREAWIRANHATLDLAAAAIRARKERHA